MTRLLYLIVGLSCLLPQAASAQAKPAPALLEKDLLKVEAVADQAILDKVEKYFNGIRTLKARFVQVSSTGAHAEGDLIMSRPGKMRLAYDPPVPVLIVANGHHVIYFDSKLKQVTHLGMDATPAGMILSAKMNFHDESIEITNVHRQPGFIEIGLRQKDEPMAGELTLVLSESPVALKQWRVRDAQGVVTEVGLFNMRTNVPVNMKDFTFTPPAEPDRGE